MHLQLAAMQVGLAHAAGDDADDQLIGARLA
jgi:hypothetical protein